MNIDLSLIDNAAKDKGSNAPARPSKFVPRAKARPAQKKAVPEGGEAADQAPLKPLDSIRSEDVPAHQSSAPAIHKQARVEPLEPATSPKAQPQPQGPAPGEQPANAAPKLPTPRNGDAQPQSNAPKSPPTAQPSSPRSPKSPQKQKPVSPRKPQPRISQPAKEPRASQPGEEAEQSKSDTAVKTLEGNPKAGDSSDSKAERLRENEELAIVVANGNDEIMEAPGRRKSKATGRRRTSTLAEKKARSTEREAQATLNPNIDSIKQYVKRAFAQERVKQIENKRRKVAAAKEGAQEEAVPAIQAPPEAAISLAPQLELVDGKLVPKAQSMTIQAQAQPVYRPVTEYSNTVNNATYSRRMSNERWTPQETEAFFNAVQCFGANFELISKLFPGRPRKALANKWRRESKANPERINEAYTGRSSLEGLEKIVEALQCVEVNNEGEVGDLGIEATQMFESANQLALKDAEEPGGQEAAAEAKPPAAKAGRGRGKAEKSRAQQAAQILQGMEQDSQPGQESQPQQKSQPAKGRGGKRKAVSRQSQAVDVFDSEEEPEKVEEIKGQSNKQKTRKEASKPLRRKSVPSKSLPDDAAPKSPKGKSRGKPKKIDAEPVQPSRASTRTQSQKINYKDGSSCSDSDGSYMSEVEGTEIDC